MSEGLLEDRLRQAGTFQGLLSLVPAKVYYGEDNTDQWMRKKQTKAEARAARMNKLDPNSEQNRTAMEGMDERAKNKRKLRELEQKDNDEEQEDDFEPFEGVEAERPGEGLKKKTSENNKKQKVDEEAPEEAPEAESEDLEEADASLGKKLSKKQEKKEKRKQKKAEKKAHEEANESMSVAPAEASNSQTSNAVPKSKGKKLKQQQAEDETKVDSDEETGDFTTEVADFSGLQDDASESAPSERQDKSPLFDSNGPNGASTEPASTSTSLSSAIPPSEKPKHIKIPSDTSALRARLAAKIEALRAARKADGPDGKPIRTRQELIESRRAKEAQRKAHKKELRLKAKAEEELKREQALASNSPSVMSPSVELDEATGNFAFGRMAFGDGTQLSHDLSYVLTNGKRKGPSDPKTALLKVQNQKKRLQELDAEKQKDIAEKEAWLTARRRVEGEKIRDDEAILKKAVKRKESAKKKSEKAWKERAYGVQQAQKERQKKREDNIRKRREDKLLGKAGKKKKAGAGAKKKSRPGFEGSLGVGRK
ncbi:unnamed protein product [Clonostachys chloroleuca]|uniref:Ribosomal RNA-processing protein 14 n=1 Tax=Clonostachys chloroleuca TaxID=1926264 RepID=A0AA35MA36_9HYPO|nr:unnamed protein product [Clonostachys chloroleuca]